MSAKLQTFPLKSWKIHLRREIGVQKGNKVMKKTQKMLMAMALTGGLALTGVSLVAGGNYSQTQNTNTQTQNGNTNTAGTTGGGTTRGTMSGGRTTRGKTMSRSRGKTKRSTTRRTTRRGGAARTTRNTGATTNSNR